MISDSNGNGGANEDDDGDEVGSKLGGKGIFLVTVYRRRCIQDIIRRLGVLNASWEFETMVLMKKVAM